jgi:hypothetical protein
VAPAIGVIAAEITVCPVPAKVNVLLTVVFSVS